MIIENSFIILLLCILQIIIYVKSNKISSYLSLYDLPDYERKIHTAPVSSIGGIPFFLFTFFILYNFKNDLDFNTINIVGLLIIFSGSFILGLLDDIYNLSSLSRIVFSLLIFFIGVFFCEYLIISNLYFEIINMSLDITNYAIPFTVLCFLVCQNALNMFDGINGASGFFATFVIIVLTYFSNGSGYQFVIISILPTLLVFLFFNCQGKIFLGNNGTYIYSSIIAALIILIYKDISQTLNILSVELIFFILIIPGLDMIRLFLVRIYNEKNPFTADKNHLHHILLENYGLKNAQIILIVIFLSQLLFLLININVNLLIFLYSFLYLLIIQKLKK